MNLWSFYIKWISNTHSCWNYRGWENDPPWILSLHTIHEELKVFKSSNSDFWNENICSANNSILEGMERTPVCNYGTFWIAHINCLIEKMKGDHKCKQNLCETSDHFILRELEVIKCAMEHAVKMIRFAYFFENFRI